jgi:hypothetical protein
MGRSKRAPTQHHTGRPFVCRSRVTGVVHTVVTHPDAIVDTGAWFAGPPDLQFVENRRARRTSRRTTQRIQSTAPDHLHETPILALSSLSGAEHASILTDTSSSRRDRRLISRPTPSPSAPMLDHSSSSPGTPLAEELRRARQIAAVAGGRDREPSATTNPLDPAPFFTLSATPSPLTTLASVTPPYPSTRSRSPTPHTAGVLSGRVDKSSRYKKGSASQSKSNYRLTSFLKRTTFER